MGRTDTIERGSRCAHRGCTAAVIHRPAQRCGAIPGSRPLGCGRYFCDEHLHADPAPHAHTPYQCQACFRPAAADPVMSGAGPSAVAVTSARAEPR